MPNWVTNKIKAPGNVITAMLGEEGKVDFRSMAPFLGPVKFDGIYMDAETAAETVLGVSLNGHPLIAGLQAESRRNVDVSKFNEESFEQFVGMLRNYRACGYLHDMDFARKVWGTKWNACEPQHDVEAGTAEFETAWSCPMGVLEVLSKRFPDDEISVVYADEDIGSNVGEFTLKGGIPISGKHAPSWSKQTDEEKAYWKAYACAVKGRDLSDYEEESED